MTALIDKNPIELSDEELLTMIEASDEMLDFGCKIDHLVDKTADISFLSTLDLSMTANKAFFRRDKQGFLAEIMDQLYGQRKVVKKKMLEHESQAELIKGILKERGVAHA